MALLNTLDKWIDEIPPLPTPQRFGNLAFRRWGKRLEDVSSLNANNASPSYVFVSSGMRHAFVRSLATPFSPGHSTHIPVFLVLLRVVYPYGLRHGTRDFVCFVLVMPNSHPVLPTRTRLRAATCANNLPALSTSLLETARCIQPGAGRQPWCLGSRRLHFSGLHLRKCPVTR